MIQVAFIGLTLLFGMPALADGRDCTTLPSKSPEEKITKKVCEGLDFRDAYRDALAIETAAREALEAGIPDDLTRKKALKEWGLAMEALDPAKDGMSASFRDAVNDTLVLYGISPAKGNGDITDGPVKGGRAVWTPTYKFRSNPDQPLLREMELPAQSGKPARMVHLKWKQPQVEEEKAFAMTWADGRVDILDEAFEGVLQKGSPRVLGFLLHHESVHFDQLRKGEWKSLNEREVDAYQASISAAPRFGLTVNEVEGLNRMLGYNRAKVWRQKIGWAATPRELPPPKLDADNAKEWDKLEQAIRVDIPAQRERLRVQLELERTGRNAASSPSNEPAPVPEENPLDVAKASSKMFCESPAFFNPPSAAPLGWSESLGRVSPILAVMDLDYRTGTMPCADYVTFQGLFLSRRGFDVSNIDILRGLVAEGLIRQTNPTPRAGRVTLPQPITAPRPVAPSPRPDPVLVPDVPDPKPDRPTPPPYNPCIHDRCIKP